MIPGMPSTIRVVLGVLVSIVAFAMLAIAADEFVVEDWSKMPVGAKGIPQEWKGQNWGSPSYDMVVTDDAGKRSLHLKSRNEGSTVSKEIKGKVKLRETPVLEWSWKAVALPKGGNSCVKATDDQGAQVYVAWRRFPELVRSRIIGYVWDTTAPAGTICKSEKTGTVTYVVVRSGSAELGKWITERRNVRDDFKKIYGDEPDDPDAVSVSIDSNDTNSFSESFMGAIVFKRS